MSELPMCTVRRIQRSLFVILLTASAACERTTSPAPRAGVVAARLVSPHSDDGAAYLEITGRVDSVMATAGTLVYTEQTSGGIMRVLLIRETPGPIQFSLRLADRSQRPTVRVLEVADGQDQPRGDLNAYRLEY